MAGDFTDDELLTIWQVGYASGFATVVRRAEPDTPLQLVGAMASVDAQDAIADPLFRAEIIGGVRRLLAGDASGPATVEHTVSRPKR